MDGRGELHLFNVVSEGACNQPLRTFVQDTHLRWLETFSQSPDGMLYVMTHIWLAVIS